MNMSMDTRVAKGKRAYDASSRQAKAAAQRELTLEVARARFLELGYSATTVESIAEAAGISPATIYKTYGGKAGLVRELVGRALEGEGPVPAEQRSHALRAGRDARDVIAGWGALVAEVSPRGAPLVLVLRAAAASDAEAAALYAEIDGARLERMADNARFLARGKHLRRGVSFAAARDVLWTCSSPELYELLVVRRGWTPRQLGEFVAQTMTAALL